MKLRINRPAQSYDFSQKLVLLVTGLTSVVIIVILLWSANLINSGGGAGMNQLQDSASEKVQQSVEPKKGYIKRESKAEARGDVIRTDNQSGLEILPPPAVGKAKPSALTDADTNTSGTATNSDLETKSIQATVDVKTQRQESSWNSGTWVINLASLQRKVDAEHFVIMVDSKGVSAEIKEVTVRGMKYWRVQVPGFSSADEARTKASEVQNKLGLKDVWILQR